MTKTNKINAAQKALLVINHLWHLPRRGSRPAGVGCLARSGGWS